MEQRQLLKLIFKTALLLICIVLAGESTAFCQGPPARIAVLTPGLTLTAVHEGLQEGLARLGYKTGQNITFVVEDTKGSTVDLAPRAAKLLAAKPDLLFTVASVHSSAAKQATATAPIVFTWVGDPVRDGLIASYASSKSNATGVSSSSAALSGKRLEVLLEVAPKVKRVLVIVAPGESIAVSTYRLLEGTATKLRITLVRRDVASRGEIEQALRQTPMGSIDAIYHAPSVVVRSSMDLLVQKAAADRIPLIVHEDSLVKQGALISYGPEPRLMGLQAAALVDKVLKGAMPRDIVVENPDRVFLAINLTTAREIGLKIPRGILERADLLID
jgi:putative ABC transport system substrate-binding protein